ncbi:hypothetical protein niasHT_036728 [Heterodera trifolii]|uniref:C2H2-type domain-containing protein n=1 Tax=Heterodera trifolii TaxID=157864 RepID=A0ABD2IQE1_9BILA
MSLNMVELYMKELLMQQKLQREYMLQQQQQQQQTQFHAPLLPLAPSPFPLFHALQQHSAALPPASAATATTSSPFPTMAPLQFGTAPGTAGPFAAAPFCAAKPMASFSSVPDQQHFVVTHEATSFDQFSNAADLPPLTPLVHQMFSKNSANSTSTSAFSAYNNNGTSTIRSNTFQNLFDATTQQQQHQSLSCCGSSLASLDSLPSPAGSSDSPDSNSSSSLCGAAAATVPTASAILLTKQPLYHHQQQQQRLHHQNHGVPVPQMCNNNGTTAANKQRLPMPMPTDFSELMGPKKVPQQQQQQKQKQLMPQKQYQQLVSNTNSKSIVVSIAGAQKRPAAQPTAACAATTFRKVRRTTVFVPIGTAKSFMTSASSTSASASSTTTVKPSSIETATMKTTICSSRITTTALTRPTNSSSTAKAVSNATATMSTAPPPSSKITPATIEAIGMANCSRSTTAVTKGTSASSNSSETMGRTKAAEAATTWNSSSTTKPTGTPIRSTTISAIVSMLLAPPKAQLVMNTSPSRTSTMATDKTSGHGMATVNGQNDRKTGPKAALISVPLSVDQRCRRTDQMPSLAADAAAVKRESVYGERESAIGGACDDHDQPPMLLRAEEAKRESVCAFEEEEEEEENGTIGDQKTDDNTDQQPPQLVLMSTAEKAEECEDNEWASDSCGMTSCLSSKAAPSKAASSKVASSTLADQNNNHNDDDGVITGPARHVPRSPPPTKASKRRQSVYSDGHSSSKDGTRVTGGERQQPTVAAQTAATPRRTTTTTTPTAAMTRGCGPIACRWTRCARRFADDNQLYDHLATDHVEQLGKEVLLAEQQQRHSGAKAVALALRQRRRGSGDDDGTANDGLSDDGGTDKDDKDENDYDDDGAAAQAEQFRCRWRKCEMHARRGDAQKKLDWLLNHLVIRHAPKAHPHKCLFANCTLRFRKLQALKDHLRSAHDDTVPKPSARRSCGDSTKTSWFELRPRVHVQNAHDCMDARTVEWLRHRLHVTLGGLDGDADAKGTDFFEDETDGMATAPAQHRRQQQNNPGTVAASPIGRMPLSETITYLRNTFGTHRRRRKRQLSPAAGATISVPAA